MFKKITSNRRRGTTLWVAFYNEFGTYIDGCKRRIEQFLEARPLAVFFVMITGILFSVSYFLYFPKEAHKKDIKNLFVKQPVTDGMSGIVNTVSTLRELLEIRTAVDELMEKDNLNSSDSLLMERAIDRMQILEKRFAQAHKHQNST